jgi:hypothetical protein
MNAISVFSDFPQAPKDRTAFVELVVNEITSGERNPLNFEVMLKNLEDTIDLIRKDERVKEAVNLEASKYAEKVFQFGNYSITKCEGKGSPDFSNDSTWVELKEKLKAREAILKAIKPTFDEIADGKTGEVLQAPIMKYSEPYLMIKYKG